MLADATRSRRGMRPMLMTKSQTYPGGFAAETLEASAHSHHEATKSGGLVLEIAWCRYSPSFEALQCF